METLSPREEGDNGPVHPRRRPSSTEKRGKLADDIRFTDRKIPNSVNKGYVMIDEHLGGSLADKAKEWARMHGLFIHNPFMAHGNVVDAEGRIVNEYCLPDFVQNHIKGEIFKGWRVKGDMID